jgi:hypothetical protein
VTALLEHIGQEGDSWLAAVFNALALLLAQNSLFGNPFPSHYLLRNSVPFFKGLNFIKLKPLLQLRPQHKIKLH